MKEEINSIKAGEEVTIYTAGGPVTGRLVHRSEETITLRYDFDKFYQDHTVVKSAVVALTRSYSKVSV